MDPNALVNKYVNTLDFDTGIRCMRDYHKLYKSASPLATVLVDDYTDFRTRLAKKGVVLLLNPVRNALLVQFAHHGEKQGSYFPKSRVRKVGV